MVGGGKLSRRQGVRFEPREMDRVWRVPAGFRGYNGVTAGAGWDLRPPIQWRKSYAIAITL
jgi:hypothetical protein